MEPPHAIDIKNPSAVADAVKGIFGVAGGEASFPLIDRMVADVATMFTIGCAGDINHRDVQWSDKQKGISEATRIGTHLASATLKAIRDAKPIEVGRIRFARQMVELRPSPHASEEVAWAQQIKDRKGSGETVAFLDQVRAGRIADVE